MYLEYQYVFNKVNNSKGVVSKCNVTSMLHSKISVFPNVDW